MCVGSFSLGAIFNHVFRGGADQKVHVKDCQKCNLSAGKCEDIQDLWHQYEGVASGEYS